MGKVGEIDLKMFFSDYSASTDYSESNKLLDTRTLRTLSLKSEATKFRAERLGLALLGSPAYPILHLNSVCL